MNFLESFSIVKTKGIENDTPSVYRQIGFDYDELDYVFRAVTPEGRVIEIREYGPTYADYYISEKLTPEDIAAHRGDIIKLVKANEAAILRKAGLL